MTTGTAKGDPRVRASRQVDRRKVELALDNCVRTSDSMGRLFLPDTLRLEWMNGNLSACNLSGRVLRADGASHLDDRRAQVNWHNGLHGITEDAPNWVLRLVMEHQP